MSERDGWEGWKRGWRHVFFGLLLAIHTARDGVPSGGSTGELALRLGLLVALVGWYVAYYGPRPVRTRFVTVPYLVGAAAIVAALTIVDSEFWIVGFAALVPVGMRYAAVVAFAVAACGALWLGHRATGTDLGWPETVASVLTIGAGIACLGYVSALDREGRERARLLDELAAAQAELAVAERRAGTLAERQRLAREVHDTLTQGFASIAMLLEAVQERRNGGRTEIDRHVATALRTARDNLTESRRLVWALRPSSLDDTGLPDAVRRLAHRVALEAGIPVRSVVTGEPVPLGEDAEAEVLRVVQEAVTNATRHAHASEITVTLSYLPDVVLVDIADNGNGRLDHRSRSGMGLLTMRQRATELGGSLTLESKPGDGTTVALAVPVRAATAPGARA